MAIDNALRHATYRMRPQPDRDETDPDVLHDHVGVLRTELWRVAGGRAQVHMRTETDASLLHAQIEQLNEFLADAYIKRSGVPAAVASNGLRRQSGACLSAWAMRVWGRTTYERPAGAAHGLRVRWRP